ncbi:unnamed protein product [Caenorhabditis angaria]|uniref:Uncharacterized protein n=1 Tax=Caenorhabditis angaria TaxID=860376 RepID=A0A9P1IFZ4_9PELO|nr:unnamed protein product [Caenorhabditis angaria]
MFKFVIFSTFLIQNVISIGRTQSTSIEGILLCEDKVASGVLVKLYEHDTASPDELMDSAETDKDGHFKLEGHADEISSIEPKINIYHDCDDGIKPCQRKLTIFIPSQYVSTTKQATKVFDLGRLQLAGKYKGETRDCLH